MRSRRADAAIVAPLARYAWTICERRSIGVTRRPRASRFSPVSTISVAIAPIRRSVHRFGSTGYEASQTTLTQDLVEKLDLPTQRSSAYHCSFSIASSQERTGRSVSSLQLIRSRPFGVPRSSAQIIVNSKGP